MIEVWSPAKDVEMMDKAGMQLSSPRFQRPASGLATKLRREIWRGFAMNSRRECSVIIKAVLARLRHFHCKIAFNTDPTPKASQRIDLIVKN